MTLPVQREAHARIDRILKIRPQRLDLVQSELVTLVADCMHFANVTGLDWGRICALAYAHYRDDLGEQA